MHRLKHGSEVRIEGQRGYYSVFTAEGYARKYNESEEAALARCRERGEVDACLQEGATVISSDRKGMAAWNNAPTLRNGEEIEVDGVRMIVVARSTAASLTWLLVRLPTKRWLVVDSPRQRLVIDRQPTHGTAPGMFIASLSHGAQQPTVSWFSFATHRLLAIVGSVDEWSEVEEFMERAD